MIGVSNARFWTLWHFKLVSERHSNQFSFVNDLCMFCVQKWFWRMRWCKMFKQNLGKSKMEKKPVDNSLVFGGWSTSQTEQCAIWTNRHQQSGTDQLSVHRVYSSVLESNMTAFEGEACKKCDKSNLFSLFCAQGPMSKRFCSTRPDVHWWCQVWIQQMLQNSISRQNRFLTGGCDVIQQTHTTQKLKSCTVNTFRMEPIVVFAAMLTSATSIRCSILVFVNQTHFSNRSRYSNFSSAQNEEIEPVQRNASLCVLQWFQDTRVPVLISMNTFQVIWGGCTVLGSSIFKRAVPALPNRTHAYCSQSLCVRGHLVELGLLNWGVGGQLNHA